VEELSRIFIVEYAGSELEASKVAIFSPEAGGGMSGAVPPLRYRVYLDLCMRVGDRYLPRMRPSKG